MIRVLFIYRFCTLGGVESILHLRLARLREVGIEPYACFLRDAGGSRSFRDVADRVVLGADANSLGRLMDDLEIDVISSVDTFEVLKWLGRNRRHRPKVLLELHSTYEATLRDLRQQDLIQPDAIVVPSDFQAANVRSYLPPSLERDIPIFVVYNSVDDQSFQEPEQWDGENQTPQIVAWIGRIDPLKNWVGFLEIAARLADRGNLEFWMVGGGYSERSAREALRHQVERRGLSSRFRWWPFVHRGDMPFQYRTVAEAGGVVVLTTRNESFGLAALETQAAGCPLVAPSVGALPEVVIDGRTGFLYAPGRTRQAVVRVSQLLDDSELRARFGKAAAEHARQAFGPERTLESLARAIRNTLDSSLTSQTSPHRPE